MTPLQLENVLMLLGDNYGIIAGHIARIDRKKFTYKLICKWEYFVSLDFQSQETQDIINNLI
jgi:hypothetical protein